MASDDWRERLEAYLDGELDAEAAAAFTAETAASPQLQSELAARQRFGTVVRGVLRGDATPLLVTAMRRDRGPAMRRARIATAATALAAVLCLLLLSPRLVRQRVRATEIRAGQVVAVRFGEIPGATVTIRTGCYNSEADRVD